MTGALIVSVLFKLTALLTVGLIGCRLAPRARAAARHAVLSALFVAAAALPVVSLLLPTFDVVLPWAIAPMSAPAIVDVVTDPISPAIAVAVPGAIHQEMAARISITRIALFVYLTGVMLTLLPLIAGFWQTRGLRASGAPWPHGRHLVTSLALEAGVRSEVEVLLHDAVPGPVTCGVWRPVILFPSDIDEWPDSNVQQAAIHELEHVRRRDWLIDCCARIICAVYWWHPLVWVAWRALRLESERAADDAVVRGRQVSGYADLLVCQAQRLISVPTDQHLIAMARRRDLPIRIASLLDESRARGRAGRGAIAVIASVMAAVVFGVASVRAVPQRPAIAAPPTPPGSAAMFDAASVKRRPGPGGGSMRQQPGGRFTAQGVSLQDLIVYAYRIQPYQIAGAPSWLDVDHWDVTAAGAPTEAGGVADALKQLLADRFSLTVHTETRDLPVYALVLARSDGRLGPALTRAEFDCAAARAEAARTQVIPPGAAEKCFVNGRVGMIEIGGSTITEMTPLLSTRLQRTVIDRTGLTGPWNATLRYTQELSQGAPSALAGAEPVLDPNAPSIITAAQEQLGLRLESTRAPVEVLVIDRAEFAREN